MKLISTTIKAVWLDKIESGEKKSELKKAKKFWRTRLQPLVGRDHDIQITFICGRRRIVKYKVRYVEYHSDQAHPIDIDGELVTEWYEIHLGEKIE